MPKSDPLSSTTSESNFFKYQKYIFKVCFKNKKNIKLSNKEIIWPHFKYSVISMATPWHGLSFMEYHWIFSAWQNLIGYRLITLFHIFFSYFSVFLYDVVYLDKIRQRLYILQFKPFGLVDLRCYMRTVRRARWRL